MFKPSPVRCGLKWIQRWTFTKTVFNWNSSVASVVIYMNVSSVSLHKFLKSWPGYRCRQVRSVPSLASLLSWLWSSLSSQLLLSSTHRAEDWTTTSGKWTTRSGCASWKRTSRTRGRLSEVVLAENVTKMISYCRRQSLWNNDMNGRFGKS